MGEGTHRDGPLGFWEGLAADLRLGPQRGRIIAVAAPKGGVGKTFVAVNLAWHLAEGAGRSVVLLSVAYGGNDAPARATTIDQRVARGTVRAIPGVSEAGLRATIESASQHAEVVIIDTPNALSDLVAESVTSADDVIVVSNHERTGAKGATMLLEMLREAGFPRDRVQLVVDETTREPAMEIEEVLAATRVDSAWLIPFEPTAAKFGPGAPVTVRAPQSPSARAIRAIATGMMGQSHAPASGFQRHQLATV
ncbi:MAG: CpaE family protein [Dehalococcoidia bacterium]